MDNPQGTFSSNAARPYLGVYYNRPHDQESLGKHRICSKRNRRRPRSDD
jgi:hypothetical protein